MIALVLYQNDQTEIKPLVITSNKTRVVNKPSSHRK